MSLLKSLARSLKQQVAGRRTWTPAEVRELIDRKAFDEARQALEHLPEGLKDRDAWRCALRGEVLFHQRDDVAAMQALREALKLKPGLPTAHYGLSLLMAEAGELEDALRHAFFADSAEPNNAKFSAQVGYCQLRLGNYPLAEGPLRRATVLMPLDPHVWNNLSLVLLAKGSLQEAHECLRLAVGLHPGFEPATRNLAELNERSDDSSSGTPAAEVIAPSDACPAMLAAVRTLEREGSLQAAIDACEELVLRAPDDETLPLELHRLYLRAGDPGSGIDVLEAFRAGHSDNKTVIGALGLAQLKLNRYREAETLLRSAAEAQPDQVDYASGLAVALMGLERFDDAAEWTERALSMAPDDLTVRTNHATNLAHQCRYEDTLAACDELEARGAAISARGMALSYLGRFDEAEAVFEQALVHNSNNPLVRFHRANLRLLTHDFERGWEDYAFRGFSNASDFRVLPLPFWRGESIKGKRVLVLAEQGLGDQIMFASCLPDLLALQPAEVIIEAIQRIAPTLQRSFPKCRVIATGQSRQLDWLKECDGVDFYVPLGDLPRYFRRSLDQFPQHSGYLRADPERVAHWRKTLELSGPGPYIGFSWKGGAEGTRGKLRTLDVMAFEPLARERSAKWVCLQYGDVADRVNNAIKRGFDMHYWPEAITDLDEFAALTSALDLVMTVCNTTVHYAGASSRPVWVLAPKVPEWRYGASGSGLPWYPSAVVYRQSSAGAWEEPLASVRRDLSGWTPEGRQGT